MNYGCVMYFDFPVCGISRTYEDEQWWWKKKDKMVLGGFCHDYIILFVDSMGDYEISNVDIVVVSDITISNYFVAI